MTCQCKRQCWSQLTNPLFLSLGHLTKSGSFYTASSWVGNHKDANIPIACSSPCSWKMSRPVSESQPANMRKFLNFSISAISYYILWIMDLLSSSLFVIVCFTNVSFPHIHRIYCVFNSSCHFVCIHACVHASDWLCFHFSVPYLKVFLVFLQPAFMALCPVLGSSPELKPLTRQLTEVPRTDECWRP